MRLNTHSSLCSCLEYLNGRRRGETVGIWEWRVEGSNSVGGRLSGSVGGSYALLLVLEMEALRDGMK